MENFSIIVALLSNSTIQKNTTIIAKVVNIFRTHEGVFSNKLAYVVCAYINFKVWSAFAEVMVFQCKKKGGESTKNKLLPGKVTRAAAMEIQA